MPLGSVPYDGLKLSGGLSCAYHDNNADVQKLGWSLLDHSVLVRGCEAWDG